MTLQPSILTDVHGRPPRICERLFNCSGGVLEFKFVLVLKTTLVAARGINATPGSTTERLFVVVRAPLMLLFHRAGVLCSLAANAAKHSFVPLPVGYCIRASVAKENYSLIILYLELERAHNEILWGPFFDNCGMSHMANPAGSLSLFHYL